jgi:sigma-B regulation protein RsbU (phosphoserine phosphatase)
MKKRVQTIGSKLTVLFCLFSLILCVVIGMFSYYASWNEYTDFYYSKARETAVMAATLVDGDRIGEYLRTGETDEYYEELSAIFANMKREYSMQYLYIYQPGSDSLIYILDAQIETDDPANISELGDVYDYEETEYQYLVSDVQAKRPSNQKHIVYGTDFGAMVMAWAPVFNNNGEVTAMVEADLSLQLVTTMLRSYITNIILICSAIILAAVVMLTLIARRMVSRPIARLTESVQGFVSESGVMKPTLELHTGDEMQTLSEAFGKMVRDIDRYTTNLALVVAEKERIGAELSVAKNIQASMLPSIFPAFPEREELDIYATMTPAKEVGGDFYDFFLVDDDRLAIVMADVSGKGVPAALFMVIAKTLLKNMAQTGRSPKDVLEKVNNQLCEGNEAEMFVTVWLGILEISTGKLTCTNAGHEYPVIKRAGGDYELIKDKHGFVLAGMEGSRYKEYELHMDPGDRLYLYTDGVAEATNSNNELYGTERMLEALNNNKNVSCEKLLYNIKEDIDSFVKEAPQFDDITMLSLELKLQNGQGMKKYKLTPTLEAMDQVTAFVEQELEAADVPMKVIAQMNIAVDEIFSNIARYSGASDATVGVSVEAGCVNLRFADNGRPYNPTEKPDPDITLPAEERDMGGLGIYMVKKSMDSVEYEYRDGLNILTLMKQS